MIYNYINKPNNNISLLNQKISKFEENKMRKNFLCKSLLNKNNTKNYKNYLYNIHFRNKFINKGLNYFIERNNNLSNYKSLSEMNRKKINIKEKSLLHNISDIKNKNIQKIIKKNFPNIFKIRNNSSILKTPKKNINISEQIKNFNNYKIKSVFYTSMSEGKFSENKHDKQDFINEILYMKNIDDNNDMLYLKELSNVINGTKNSKYNFFHKDKIFNLQSFSIIGITSSEGKSSILISRLLKKFLIDYFTNIKHYYNYANLKSKPIINKQLIYEILTSNSYEFIKNILNMKDMELKIFMEIFI